MSDFLVSTLTTAPSAAEGGSTRRTHDAHRGARAARDAAARADGKRGCGAVDDLGQEHHVQVFHGALEFGEIRVIDVRHGEVMYHFPIYDVVQVSADEKLELIDAAAMTIDESLNPKEHEQRPTDRTAADGIER